MSVINAWNSLPAVVHHASCSVASFKRRLQSLDFSLDGALRVSVCSVC